MKLVFVELLSEPRKGNDVDPDVVFVETDLSAQDLREVLSSWAPWRHEIQFSNGVKTSDLETFKPFNPKPWYKIRVLERKLTLPRGRTALDIGCNSGYNSLFLQKNYDMNGIGIDWSERHVEASSFLNRLAGGENFEFEQADANFFCRPDTFDLILHFGTLYHLKHPILSLENCAESLKRDGWLALETQCYGEGTECLYIRGDFNDKSNWFALGPKAIVDILQGIGLVEVDEIFVWRHERLGTGGSRRMFVARKPL